MAAENSPSMAFQDRRQYEQALMRAGRRLQSLGQLLEQDPTRVVGKGFDFDPQITGPRPLQIEMDELRAMFDPQSPTNVGRLLAEYQSLVASSQSSQ
jgi:alkanesulfonate monooxygenase SsuD/methylene tetrahydromethanopterin reductase-like flavin-dependent oxidoreductase (luciferase family)